MPLRRDDFQKIGIIVQAGHLFRLCVGHEIRVAMEHCLELLDISLLVCSSLVLVGLKILIMFRR
jgi:hypothetical protein